MDGRDGRDGRDEHDERDETAAASEERLVYVIDLTTSEVERAHRRSRDDEPFNRGESNDPPQPPEAIDTVALLLDGWEEPLLLEVEPTLDGDLLDALARLLKIAVLAGERVPTIAVSYGEEYERALAFERRLPAWIYDGLDSETTAALPVEVRRVLSPRRR